MSKSYLLFSLLSGSVLALSACGTDVDGPSHPSRPEWHTGPAALRGHEDLMRFAVKEANQNLGTSLFPQVPEGDSGNSSSNPLVRGSYETDFPGSGMTSFYGGVSDWHNDERLQSLHFLREFSGGAPLSLGDACRAGVARIRRATLAAQEKWAAGDRNGAFFWLGHASHIIQDSFSADHARRTSDGKRITDICTYGRGFDGVCRHPTVSERDRVWSSDGGWSCQLNPNERGWKCLDSKAQQASKATAGYLESVGRALVGNSDSGEALEAYLVSDAVRNGGYFVCPQ